MTASEPTAMTLEQGIAEIGELGLVILRDSGPGDTWNIYDPHSDDRWFGQTLAGTIEAVLSDVAIRRDEAAELRAQNAELVEALALLIETIDSHNVVCSSCDRDGNEFCDCIEANTDRARAVLASVRGDKT